MYLKIDTQGKWDEKHLHSRGTFYSNKPRMKIISIK